jgi:hypothetical protein
VLRCMCLWLSSMVTCVEVAVAGLRGKRWVFVVVACVEMAVTGLKRKKVCMCVVVCVLERKKECVVMMGVWCGGGGGRVERKKVVCVVVVTGEGAVMCVMWRWQG